MLDFIANNPEETLTIAGAFFGWCAFMCVVAISYLECVPARTRRVRRRRR